jgi:hypothetical protein
VRLATMVAFSPAVSVAVAVSRVVSVPAALTATE